tara:strand:- start:747 stop:1805 length:1059 start_codon:yes stop_codon:yes gene_type:complete
MVVKQKLKVIREKQPSSRLRPAVIKWKDEHIIRQHSFIAPVKEIIVWAEEIDVTRVGIIGDMHSGKSTMAAAIAHVIHKFSKLPWAIRHFDENDLLDFEKTLGTLKPANYIMIFDDVSFLSAKANKKQLEAVKAANTKIRHLPGGHDVKIILIYNYHYNMGLDKYLRQADFRFFTTVGSSEKENMEKIVGTKSMKLVMRFQKMRANAVVKKKFTFMLSKNEPFTYKWRQPFIPVLYYNQNSLRIIVSPTREWMDPVCSGCSESEGSESEINVETFVDESVAKFGTSFKIAAKLKLFTHGYLTHSRTVVQAYRYLEKALDTKIITLDDIASKLGLEETNTKLRKQMDGVLTEP